jgi:hypothetical protein
MSQVPMQVKEVIIDLVEGMPETAEANPGGLELVKAARTNHESG